MSGSQPRLTIFSHAEVDKVQANLLTGMGWQFHAARPGEWEQAGGDCIVCDPALVGLVPAEILQSWTQSAPLLIDAIPFQKPTLEALSRLSDHARRDAAPNMYNLLVDVSLDNMNPPVEFSSLTSEEVWELYAAQRKLLYAITSTTPDFLYLFTLDGRFVFANARLLAVWGRKLPDVIGKTCLELGYEQWHHDMHMGEIEQVKTEKKAIVGEVEFRAPLTGIFGVYEYIFTPVFDPEGNVALVAGTTRDVTRRKQTEEHLKHNRQLLEVALAASDTGTFRWDPNSGQFLAMDPTFLRIFSFEADSEAPDDQDMLSRIHPGDVADVTAAIEGLRQGRDLDLEFRVMQPDGSFIWVYDRAVVILGPNGEVQQVVGACTDITRMKNTELELRAAERNREFIMESLPQKLFINGPDGRLLYNNQIWVDYCGLSLEELQQDWHSIIHPADLPQNLVKWKHALETGAPFSIEHRFRNIDGEYRWHVSRAVPMYNEQGDIQLWMGSSTDIHDVKMAQQMLEEREDRLASLNLELQQTRDAAVAASTAKSKFLASMSHELRTPLNAIIGYSEMLRDDLLEHGAASMVEDLEKILLSARHLLAVISDILDISKLEAGKMDFEIQSFDLREIVEEASTLMAPLIEKNQNQLEWIFPDDDPLIVTSDRVRVRQILFNLLSNAAKFTENGHIAISCARRVSTTGTGFVELAVADSGIGIDESKINQLFQEFSQLERRTHPMFGGTGLGLAISRRLCQLLGGEIEVVSEKDKGSVFTVYLPIQFDGSTCRVGDLTQAGK